MTVLKYECTTAEEDVKSAAAVKVCWAGRCGCVRLPFRLITYLPHLQEWTERQRHAWVMGCCSPRSPGSTEAYSDGHNAHAYHRSLPAEIQVLIAWPRTGSMYCCIAARDISVARSLPCNTINSRSQDLRCFSVVTVLLWQLGSP